MSQPPPGPPQPGGPEPYYPPYAQQPVRSVNGGLILALGIVGLLFCSLLGPIAVVMGNSAVAAIDRGEASPNERGSANAGRVLGMISSFFLGLSVLLIIAAASSPDFRQGFMRGFNQSYHHTAPSP